MKINIELESLEELRAFTEQILVGDPTYGENHQNSAGAPATAAAPVAPPPKTQENKVDTPAHTEAPVTVDTSVAAPAAGTVPTTSVSYTLDDLARAGMTLMDSGRQAELQQLLAQFGVEALPTLPKEKYGAFATALRGLGAQI